MAIVTFDFDGTLYEGKSFNAMFKAAKSEFSFFDWVGVAGGMLKSLLLGGIKGKEALKHHFFKSFVRTFKGKSERELEEFFMKLVQIGKSDANLSLINKLKEHERNGDIIIILSGALYPFLKAFCEELNLNAHLITTQLLFDKKLRSTGKIGELVNGDEKVSQLQAWLHKHKLDKNEEILWAYADSESDIPLLTFVDHPIVVNPSPAMKKVAEEKKWPIFKK